MASFNHFCPHCVAMLSVDELPVEKAVGECPSCHNTILLLKHGAVIKKPIVYRCLKCHDELVYEQRPPVAFCHNCNSLFVTSKYGNCLINPKLLEKGDNGELEFQKKRDYIMDFRNNWALMSKLQKFSIYSIFIMLACVCLAAYVYSLPPAIESSLAYSDMENVWKEFRKKNPYNIQIEGLKRYDDNSYVAIISEPNERVSEKELKAFFDNYNCEFRTDTAKIGYDGWLRDVVVSFNDLDEADIPEFSKKLSMLLYGTDYKADVVNLNTIPEHKAFSSFDLNCQVTEEELRNWFIEKKEKLVKYESEEITTLPYIFSADKDKNELYYSKECGFIVWVLDTGLHDELSFKIAARKFALDSDLVLGAIRSGNKVAIIARERCVPIYELSPMRQETLCLLASTGEKQLAQSYERTSLFAGKQKGGKDYAPIYLSDELWHTEYGNILNVTDQMLKSWSENGMVDYVDFDYPKPVNWVFNKGVCTDLGVSKLTYNWNTDGAGYIVEDDSCYIYALNRTGSLPVSYIPGESTGVSDKSPVYQAEQQAYDFFSNLSSPELVKVVQYVAMYQIFSNFGISVEKNEEPFADEVMAIPDILKQVAISRMDSLVSFDQKDKVKIAKYYNAEVVTEDVLITDKQYNTGFSIGHNQRVVKTCKNAEGIDSLLKCKWLIETLIDIRDSLLPLANDKTLMESLGIFTIDKRAHILHDAGAEYFYNIVPLETSLLQTSVPIPRKSYKDCILSAMDMLSRYSSEIKKYNSILGGLTPEQSKRLYLKANKNSHKTWMKCPTIVESWNLIDSVHSQGGHNLNSNVIKFSVDKNLKPGETRIENNGVIKISPTDRIERVSNQDYIRQVARLGNNDMGKSVTIRPKSAVIGATMKRTTRGFNPKDHLIVDVDFKFGHTMNGKFYSDFTELLNDLGSNMEDGKSQFKQIEITGLKGAGVDVDVFLDGVRARMRKGSSANIPLERYDFSCPSVKYEGEKVIVTIPIKAGHVIFSSTSSVVEAGFGGSSNYRPKLKLKGGDVTFKIPKNKLRQFLEIISEYIVRQKGAWNDFKIKIEMKRRGISPTDCEEKTRLKVAKNYLLNKTTNYVWIPQEKTA